MKYAEIILFHYDMKRKTLMICLTQDNAEF